MPEGDPADRFGGQVGVGDLKGEANGESHVGEIEIGGRLVLVEVDPADLVIAVVGPRVAEREHGVHAEPRERHAQHTKTDQCSLSGSGTVRRLQENETDDSQTSHAGTDNDGVREGHARVLFGGDLGCGDLVEAGYLAPDPQQEHGCGRVPRQ